ncbi:GYDIA family GHMP kinase [Tamlana sp. 2201CG12-4]|uniref:GYDIA family GHMP kinase n=1 Tax=Tamlana sp. 2201CG12-4 TaxID=3112582 RepID=UPI002DB924EE|nr:GYDIA family GHMP kinase [Tamlana sp. 2201CG12-4]MEC3907058.1 GYDIA family GHMP kinase [Tamlana sp. 2201CG12-4]
MKSKVFYSNGKLLISGEYVVLDGALSFAVPTKFGQSLTVETIEHPKLIWNSIDNNGLTWFTSEFEIKNNRVLKLDQYDDISKRLIQIFNTIRSLNPDFLNNNKGYKITTKLDFATNWGLGTSSTLINNLAQWAGVDAYTLLENSFGGSGYDIACAQHHTPITYQIKNGKPLVKPVEFAPDFIDNLYFVHLNKKQNSREGIKHYKENKQNSNYVIKEINTISLEMIKSNALEDFENLITKHEYVISKITKQTPVKAMLFEDYPGSIKSLGAWGGDFVLATSKSDPTEYFKRKGFETVIPYKNMVL